MRFGESTGGKSDAAGISECSNEGDTKVSAEDGADSQELQDQERAGRAVRRDLQPCGRRTGRDYIQAYAGVHRRTQRVRQRAVFAHCLFYLIGKCSSLR